MSIPTKVDVAIGSHHFNGFQFGDNGPISIPAEAVVAIGDIISVDGRPCKVTNAITDQVNSKAMHINIYIAPVAE